MTTVTEFALQEHVQKKPANET